MSTKQGAYEENDAEKTATGRSIYRFRMADPFFCIFCLPGYFYGIFKYVRQHDNNYTDYAVALRMYVYHFAWRRAERTAGENFV